MKVKLYSVLDLKAEKWANPFPMGTRGEALRSWQTIANDEASAINQYPEDFRLYEIGEFDVITGKLTQHELPVSLGLALEFVKPKEKIIAPFRQAAIEQQQP